MSDCKRTSNLFGALHEEQLDGEISENVRRHLSICSECREDFKWYGFTVHALTSLERVSPPAEFMVQVRARLDGHQPAFSLDSFRNIFSLFPNLPLPVTVTALALIAVGGLSLYNYEPVYILRSSASTYSSEEPQAELSAAKGVIPRDSQGQARSLMVRSQEPSHSSLAITPYPGSISGSKESDLGYPGCAMPAGINSLTVESPGIDQAVASLKRMLPDIRGTLLEEHPQLIGGTVLTVMIPPKAYGYLTTELVNHGAVAVGCDSESYSPPASTGETDGMRLNIHFVRSR
jgi:hypothetical protein